MNATPAKRACGTQIINIMSQMSNNDSPYFFRPHDAPSYIPTMLLIMWFSDISICTCILM